MVIKARRYINKFFCLRNVIQVKCKELNLIFSRQYTYVEKPIMKKWWNIPCNISNIVRRIVAANGAHKHNLDFEVNPLDINIARIQWNLIEKYSNGIQEDSNFDVIIGDFEPKAPVLNVSNIVFLLRSDSKFEQMILNIRISHKKKNISETFQLIRGNKVDILYYIRGMKFFRDCKYLVYMCSYMFDRLE